jgi:hypothetical protein
MGTLVVGAGVGASVTGAGVGAGLPSGESARRNASGIIKSGKFRISLIQI